MASYVQNNVTRVVEFGELRVEWQQSAQALYVQISNTGKPQNQLNHLLEGFQHPPQLKLFQESLKDVIKRLNIKSSFFNFCIKK